MNILDELVAKGVAGDVIVAVAKLMAQAEQLAGRRESERKRMKAVRERVRTEKTSTKSNSACANVCEQALFSLPSSTINNLKVQEERLEIVALGREFVTFWQQYPHKVGKRAAATAFERARRRTTFEIITAGLDRYAAKTDDRPWCNPATWLNQDRWDDQPGPAQEGNGNGRGRQAPKDDPKSIRGAFDRLFARLDGGDEFGEPSRQTNLRVIPGGSG